MGPVEGRDLKLFVEGDFYGTANGFRLRHAYGEYGPLLAGQTWTTFMDEANIPNTIDFETPLAAPLVRQGLLRLTARPSQRTLLALGIEESDPEVLPPRGVAGKTEKTLPDFTGRFRFTNGRGHVQLSGFVGQTRFRPDKGEPTDVTIYGGLASARFRTLLRDVAYAQFSYGPGLGRYRGDLSAAPDADGQLKAVKVMALTLGYEHYWAARWSSNFVASPAWYSAIWATRRRSTAASITSRQTSATGFWRSGPGWAASTCTVSGKSGAEIEAPRTASSSRSASTYREGFN